MGAMGSPSVVASEVVPFRTESSPLKPTLSMANLTSVFFTTLYSIPFFRISRRSAVSCSTLMPL
jgi:hypothetical protein